MSEEAKVAVTLPADVNQIDETVQIRSAQEVAGSVGATSDWFLNV